MGLSGGELALLVGTLGSGLLGGITAPQGQKLSSFEGSGGSDPHVLMGENKGLIDDLLGSLIEKAGEPITMRTTVNPLPSFKGGALPMPISAPGMDATRLNPALRETPGTKIPRRRLTPAGGQTPGYGGPNQPPLPGSDTPGYGNGPPPGQEHPPNEGDPNGGPAGTYAQDPNHPDAALAALQLLMPSTDRSHPRSTF